MTIGGGASRVQVSEIDRSTRVPSFPGVYGGIVVAANRGPVNVPTLCITDKQILQKFTPNERVDVGMDSAYFSALAFVQKGKLWFIRAAKNALFGGLKVGVSSGSNSLYTVGKNSPEDDLYGLADPDIFTVEDALSIYAADPGDWNSDVKILLKNYETSPSDVKEPGAFQIKVYYKDLLQETWICSRDPNHKDGYGRNIYVDSVLSGSNYIKGINNTTVDKDTYPAEIATAMALYGGDDGDPVTSGTLIETVDLFANPDDVNVTLVLDGGNAFPEYHNKIIELCENRMDCFGLLSVPYEDESNADYINQILDYRNVELNANTSYACLTSPHVKIYDYFNDRAIWVAPDGYFGACISQTAAQREMWYPAAGPNRGLIKVLDVRRRFVSFGDNSEMDVLYDAGINPIRFKPGKGIMIDGQKTLLSRPSALDRMNCRFLLLVIEPAIKEALDAYRFELNTPSERSRVTTLIKGYMNGIMARLGVTSFQVVCDDSNNTPEDIDNYIMNVDLYVAPTRPIEYIQFNVIVTRTGAATVQLSGA